MMCRNFSLVMRPALVILAMVSGGAAQLQTRAFDGPQCTPMDGTWSWMDNMQGKGPCLTVAYLQGACLGSDYRLNDLPPGQKYDPPNATDANPCYCSWAVYNLYSACERCQGAQNAIVSWATWNTSCGAFPSTSAWPAQHTPTGNTTFPRWAAHDPTMWTDGRWNQVQAQSFANNNPGDASLSGPSKSTPNEPKKANHVGAIAGGVIGGVVAIAIGVAIALFLFCRNKRRKARQAQMHPHAIAQAQMVQHVRSPSDLSAKTYGSGFGYAPLGHASSPSSGSTNRLLHSPTTFVTHNSSRVSFTGQESLLASIGYAATPPPQGVVTPPNNVYVTPHGTVSPFTLHQPSSSETPSSHDRKRSEASVQQPGDASGSAPNPVQPRSPMNPPAYSEAPHGHGDFSSQAHDGVSTYGSTSIVTTPPSNPSRGHEKNPSAGSMGSHRSDVSTSGGYWTQTNSASLSGAADLLSQMSSGNIPGPSAPTPAYIGPGPGVTIQRDEKRRPTIMNSTPADAENHERQE